MALLHRYIWRQTFWPSLLALLALNLLFLLIQLLRIGSEALGMGLKFGDVAEMSLLLLPGLAVFTLPVSAMIGIMLGFGRLAEEGETVTLLTSGAGPRRLLTVPLALGLATGALTFLFSNWLAPRSSERLRQQAIDMAWRNIAASLRQGRFFEEIPGLVLLPGEANGEKSWQGFMVYDRRQAPRHILMLAKSARVGGASERRSLLLELADGRIHLIDWHRQDYVLVDFREARFRLELEQLLEQRTRFISATDHLSWAELGRLVADNTQPRRLRLLAEASRQRRLVFPAAAPLFTCLGTLLSLNRPRSSRWNNLWQATGLVAGYYLLMRFSDALAEKLHFWPALAAWMPFAALLGATFLFWPRVGRPR